MRLWITRSESAAKRLQQALGGLAEDQLKLTCAALIKVEQIDPWQYSQAQWQSDQLSWHRLDHLPDSSCVVVVSVTAAQCYLASQVVQNERTHIAVGDATAAALKARGLRVEVPKIQSSEGLAQLEWPRWLDAEGSVWLVSGIGGRELIAQQLLQQFKTRVCKIATYQRIDVEPGPLTSREISLVDVIEISSLQALNNLSRLYPESCVKQIVVPSRRLMQKAQEASFKNIVVADSANAADILKSLQR